MGRPPDYDPSHAGIARSFRSRTARPLSIRRLGSGTAPSVHQLWDGEVLSEIGSRIRSIHRGCVARTWSVSTAGRTWTRRHGVVYEAIERPLGRRVAIKILPFSTATDRSLVERMLREAQIVAHLDHPRIVKVYAAGEVEGVHYIAFQLMEGGSLSLQVGSDWSSSRLSPENGGHRWKWLATLGGMSPMPCNMHMTTALSIAISSLPICYWMETEKSASPTLDWPASPGCRK